MISEAGGAHEPEPLVAAASPALVAAPAMEALSVPAPPADHLAAGKADFMKHGAPCHSPSGKGNGPEVNVIPGIKPADLTKITMKNGKPATQGVCPVCGTKVFRIGAT